MKSNILSLLFFSVLVLAGCSHKEEKIVKPADYAVYLNRDKNEALTRCNEEIAFWKTKLSEVPESETYRSKIAGLLSSRFSLNGRIEDVQASDSLYQLIVSNTKQDYASMHRAIAANCITQHKFREARTHIEKALAIGEGKAASLYMLVDVSIELGDYATARTAMKEFTNKNFFPYVIRHAKLLDHAGKLDSAILLMETAMQQVSDNPGLLLWTRSNLADMYGHAGRVKEAYATYLEVLTQDPDYDYALKGIAWIAFSHDHDYQEARRIANVIKMKRATPDMHLFLAEIAEAENNVEEKNIQLDIFKKSAGQSHYGDMYNKYIALLEAEEFSNAKATIAIAKKEIDNRPTAQSYDLLAWGYFLDGNKEEALAVAKKYVESKTYEPDAMYHLAMIYKANGETAEAERYFEEASQSAFELGPAIAGEIEKQLD